MREELKEARREQKRVRLEEKKKNREDYRQLKKEYKKLPKAVIKEAVDHYGNKDMLANYLKAMNGQAAEDEVQDIRKDQEMIIVEETKLPSVPYDHDISKGPKGPDNFVKFRVELFEAKDKLKELKKEEKGA